MVLKKLGILGTALCSLASCATPRMAPSQLQEARATLNEARESENAQYVLADLHRAQTSLDQAENAWKAEESDSKVDDLAYVAQRKAALAMVRGQNAAAINDEKVAHAENVQYLVKKNDQRRDQVAKLQSELEKTQAVQEAQDAAQEKSDRKSEEKSSGSNEQSQSSTRNTDVYASTSVQFESGSHNLSNVAKRQLDELVDGLLEASNRELRIEGFADATGRDTTNANLSQRRAERVMEYLVKKGVPPTEISAQGLGSQSAVADNSSSEGRASNRRVQVIVRAETREMLN